MPAISVSSSVFLFSSSLSLDFVLGENMPCSIALIIFAIDFSVLLSSFSRSAVSQSAAIESLYNLQAFSAICFIFDGVRYRAVLFSAISSISFFLSHSSPAVPHE
ncbi:MAG TPA: hypothetical protein DIW26_08830 [Ruminococcus sp.]|nr:hypothetical protein [Ruminococcus sp.]